LYVTANIENANVFKEVQFTVETIKPANLIYQQNTALGDIVALEERVSMRTLTWETRLGSWQLGAVPFANVGPEVILK
jgi:hypothetical protein